MNKIKKKIKIYEGLDLAQILAAIKIEDMRARFAIDKNIKALRSRIITPYVEIEQELHIEFALEKDGKIVKNKDGQYEYSKEGQKDLLKAKREALDKSKEVELTELTIIKEMLDWPAGLFTKLEAVLPVDYEEQLIKIND